MKVSIAICTWNRADLLNKTLTQMLTLKGCEEIDWELIVVDNNSTDQTADVVQRFQTRLPIRRVFESKQGHSYARNRAIHEVTGDLLIWTDDDVLVEPDWLTEYVKAATEHPSIDYFGGPIDPWFETTPPGWFLMLWEHIKGVYVIRDYSGDIRLFDGDEQPAGANMGFRTAVARENLYDTELGRKGDSLTGADDTEMIARLRSQGKVGLWVGTARVKHFLPTKRLSAKYLKEWFIGGGMIQFRKQPLMNEATLFGFPRWALVRFLICKFKSLLLSPIKGKAWLDSFREAANLQGYLRANYQLRSDKATNC